MTRLRILIMFLLPGLALAAEARGEGRLIRFDEPVQNVDTIRFDQGALTLRYPFQNVSSGTVSILEIRSSCGCLTGRVDSKAVRPGAKAVLTAVLDPHTLYGNLDRHLTIVASDGTNTVLSSITVKGYVKRDQSEGEIRYASPLGRGLRTDSPVNSLYRDKFGDYVFSIPLYNDTDSPVTLEVEASRRFKLYAPASIPARSRVDLRGEYRTLFVRNGSQVSEELRLKVDGQAVTPLLVKGIINK